MRRRRKPWGYESRGIPFSVGCLPELLFFGIMVAIAVFAPSLIEQCVGRPIEPPRGKAGAVYMLIELVCSPLLLFGSATDILLFVLLLSSLFAMGLAWLWIRKHQAYWDVIRAKEREKRRQKRLEKERRILDDV
jgi:hypothetical protein